MKLTAPHVSSMESGDYVADIRGEKYNDFLNIIYSLWLHRSSTTSNLKKKTQSFPTICKTFSMTALVDHESSVAHKKAAALHSLL